VFISEVQKRLAAFLKAAGIRIWLMLDRLDEVFPRRTNMEKVALRALLQTTKSFASPRVRLKVFLRDDILEYITERDGFTGLTHVTARATQTLTWTKADLVHLIVSRVFASDAVAKCFTVDKKRLTTDEAYRYECFLKVFPQQVERGQKRSSTIDWLISHCQDGKGVVTPRDIIDLLLNARSNQLETEQKDPHEHEFLIGPAALKYGHVELSKRKRESYLLAEFPHFAEDILKLQGSKSEHNLDSLRALYGNRTDDVVKNLYAIGLLQRRTSDTYSIPFLFRPGLELRQGKAYRTGVRH
jgi:hypothetical protein